jgi:hypothetical protein
VSSAPVSTPRLPTLDEVRANVPLDGAVCAYVSGATGSGWEHPASDLDLYVVSLGPPKGAWERVRAQAGLHEDAAVVPRLSVSSRGRRWDVEYWTEQQMGGVVSRFFDPYWAAHLREDPPFDDLDVEFLHRVRTAIPLLGADWLAGFVEDVDWDGIRRVLLERRLDAVDAYLEEALGLLAHGDVPGALLAAREAFVYVVDALTVNCGFLSVKRKWRARRMAELQPPELPFEEYWNYEIMAGYTAASAGRWIEGLVRRCRELVLTVPLALPSVVITH